MSEMPYEGYARLETHPSGVTEPLAFRIIIPFTEEMRESVIDERLQEVLMAEEPEGIWYMEHGWYPVGYQTKLEPMVPDCTMFLHVTFNVRADLATRQGVQELERKLGVRVAAALKTIHEEA